MSHKLNNTIKILVYYIAHPTFIHLFYLIHYSNYYRFYYREYNITSLRHILKAII